MTKNMISFSHRTYTNLLKTSSKLALQYRIDCGLEKPAPKEEVKDVKKEIKPDYAKEDLRKFLKDAEVKFFSGANPEKLLELCISNKLI